MDIPPIDRVAVVPILPLHGEDNTDYKNSLGIFSQEKPLANMQVAFSVM